jgi:hypothetical protein
MKSTKHGEESKRKEAGLMIEITSMKNLAKAEVDILFPNSPDGWLAVGPTTGGREFLKS